MGDAAGTTVTTHCAAINPFVGTTRITAVPSPTAVTFAVKELLVNSYMPAFPLELTNVPLFIVNTSVVVPHLKVAVAPLGFRVAVIVNDFPRSTVKDDGYIDIDVRETGAALTETMHVAVLLLLVFAVMVADPALTAVTTPAEFTVATEVLSLLHVIVVVALDGVNV